MTIHRRLNRPEIYRELARISRKYKKLNFCRFCIQAMNKMNPDLNDDPDNNFSLVEAVRGFLSPKPTTDPQRQGDLRIYIDELGRPDKYAIDFLKREILRWNKQIRNKTSLLYIYPCKVVEIKPANSRRTEQRTEVIYDYIRILKGNKFVGGVQDMMRNVITGLETRIEFTDDSRDVRRVDTSVRNILEENERIQNGREE